MYDNKRHINIASCLKKSNNNFRPNKSNILVLKLDMTSSWKIEDIIVRNIDN
jgi:hypothetical protein